MSIPVENQSAFLLRVLDFVLAEKMAGRKVNDHDVAKHFNITLEQAVKVHDELEAAGEFE